MILLHGTTVKRWRAIQSEGLKALPEDPAALGEPGSWISFGNLALAGYHAEWRAHWDGNDEPVLLALDATALLDSLRVDRAAVLAPFEKLLGVSRDDLRSRWAASGQSWRDSLALFGAVNLPLAAIPVASLICLPLKPVGVPEATTDSTGLGYAGQIQDDSNRPAWRCSHSHSNYEAACACATATINRRRLLQHPLRAALKAAGLQPQQLREIAVPLPFGALTPLEAVETLV